MVSENDVKILEEEDSNRAKIDESEDGNEERAEIDIIPEIGGKAANIQIDQMDDDISSDEEDEGENKNDSDHDETDSIISNDEGD